MHKYIQLITLLFLGFFQSTIAQEKNKDSIGTETVTVVKAYKPTISDAFKIKLRTVFFLFLSHQHLHRQKVKHQR